MNKIETLIKVNIDKHPNFEEYFKIIYVIKENENTNPDICIESCKALIEGVSKTIYNKVDASKSIAELDKYTSVEKLFKDAISKLAEKCDDDFEGDFVRQYSSMIHVIGEIRNKRGDISHGRVAPKPIYSSVKFASTVVKMTSSILEYILEHYFQLDINPIIKLDFDAEEMEVYNSWLDDSVSFPIAKARYSKVLYENDYDEYEIGYNDYLKSIEKEDVETEEKVVEAPKVSTIKDTPSVAPLAGDPIETLSAESISEIKHEDKTPQVSIFHSSYNPFEAQIEASKDNSKYDYDLIFGSKSTQKREVVQLVNSFDVTTYWNSDRIECLNLFEEFEDVSAEKLKPIIEEYLFSGKRPLRDKVVECLNQKPALKDRARIVDELIDKIIDFVDNDLN
jgi:hypothetical protein